MALDRNRLLKPVRKLQKLVDTIGRHPTPAKVHDLRTNARRFEAIFEALSLDEKGLSKSMLKNLGRLLRRAGKVRDMDVLTSYASMIHLNGEEDCAVQLLEYLGVQRRKHAKKLSVEIQKLRPELRADLKRTPAILAKCISESDRAPLGSVAASAITTAETLTARLAAPQRLGIDNLHRYRLKIKELGYVLHMAAGTFPKFVDVLGKVKDSIGEWHDWQHLATISQKELNHGNRCAFVSELKRIAKRKFVEAMSLTKALRKKYLRNSGALKHAASADSPKVPRDPVWEAIAMLGK